MNKLSLLAGSFLAVLLAGVTFAQDPQATAPNTLRQRKGLRHIAKLLRKQDANNDGKLARDEWKGKAQRFDRLDKDHDGFITREEVASLGKQGRGALRKFDFSWFIPAVVKYRKLLGEVDFLFPFQQSPFAERTKI